MHSLTQRVVYTGASVVAAEKQAMLAILWEIIQLDSELTFYWPLDVSQLPRYDAVVTNPLDLCTITAKVHCQMYETMLDFEDDLVDMLVNCCMYNQANSPFFKTATTILSRLPEVFGRHGVAMVRGSFLAPAGSKSTTSSILRPAVAMVLEVVMQHVLIALRERDVQGQLVSFVPAVPLVAGAPTPSLMSIQAKINAGAYSAVAEFHREVDFMLESFISQVENSGAAAAGAIAMRLAMPQLILTALSRVSDDLRGGLTTLENPATAPIDKAIRVRRRAPSAADPDPLILVVEALEQLDPNRWFWSPLLDPAYHKAISRPIDFFTMKFKVRNGVYGQGSAKGFVDDVELLVDNCVSYTGPDSAESKLVCQIRAQLPQKLKQFGVA